MKRTGKKDPSESRVKVIEGVVVDEVYDEDGRDCWVWVGKDRHEED